MQPSAIFLYFLRRHLTGRTVQSSLVTFFEASNRRGQDSALRCFFDMFSRRHFTGRTVESSLPTFFQESRWQASRMRSRSTKGIFLPWMIW